MKKIQFTLMGIMFAPLLIMAQYTGGNGRGDHAGIYLECANPSSGGAITIPSGVCSGFAPATLFDSVAPSGQNGTLKYQWQSSVTGDTTGFTDITDADTSFYTPGGLTVTTWFRRLAGVTCKTGWTGAASSNVVKIAVQPLLSITLAGSGITAISATGNGKITATCGDNATNRGVIWYPFSDSLKTIGGYQVENVDETGDFDTGSFSREITGLTVNTRYSYRAHATNPLGAGYGDKVDFWTLANFPGQATVNNPTTTTLDVAINANGNPAITTYAIYDTVTGKYVQANGTFDLSAAWQTEALWEVNAGNTAKTVTGLNENTKYVFKVKAKNGNNVETDFSSKDSLYTLAKVPTVPTVNAATETSVNVAINANGNPAATQFAIQETGGGKYVQANGSLDVAAVWQTEAVWQTDASNSAKTVTGLAVNTQNTFKVKARNGNNMETDFSGTTSLYTLANVPSAPTVNNPTATTLDITINANGSPASTEFAIHEVPQNKSPLNKYVQTNGTLGATVVWATAATWGTKTVTGLTTGATYTFEVKARNGVNTETAYSASATQNTCSNPTDGGEIGSNQTICSGSTPNAFTSTSGASNFGGTLEYKWQISTTSDATGFNDINSSNSTTFSPGALTQTSWYKRLARVDCKTDWICAAESNVVKITVRPVFTAGAIATAGETICLNGDPSEIGSTTDASGGDAVIAYQWQCSTNAAFTSPTTISSNSASYDPPTGLTVETWYRRQAKDETCNTSWNTSSGVWKVTPVSPTPVLTGDTTVIQGQVVTYETAYTPGNSYTWNASHGNPVLCFPNHNCLTLTWDFPCGIINPGYVKVTETNQMGCSTTITKWITIAP